MFTDRLGNALITDIQPGATVQKIDTNGNHYVVTYKADNELHEVVCEHVVSTLSAYQIAPLIKHLSTETATSLSEIIYPPLVVLNLAYPKNSISQPLDGFGFLVPKNEHKHFLGAIWNSIVFPQKAPEDLALFTLFIGGVRDQDALNTDKEQTIKNAIKEFELVMQINAEPVLNESHLWNHSIPQLNLGYLELLKKLELFESRHLGFHISGNFRSGVAVGDCITYAKRLVSKIKEFDARN